MAGNDEDAKPNVNPTIYMMYRKMERENNFL